jgi:hypothetical protein
MRRVFLTFFLCSHGLLAQYKHAVGVRLLDQSGISLKWDPKNIRLTPELILADFGRGLKTTFLLEKHQRASFGSGWRWYVGAGGHMGLTEKYRGEKYGDPYMQLGVDGILGIEHTFTGLPLNISLDWKPEFNLGVGSGLHLPVFGFSARYIF